MVERIGLSESYGPRAPRPGDRQSAPALRPTGRFQELLNQRLEAAGEVKWSAHAQSRLISSRIDFTESHRLRLAEAVRKAEAKGARESLILLDGMALVVSIKNRTVITAVSPERTKENVFTNIDSAVIG